MWNRSTRLIFTLAACVVLIALAGCGSDNADTPVIQGVRSGTATPGGSITADTTSAVLGLDTTPEPGKMALPALDALGGSVMLIRQDQLYQGRFDGSDMRLVADRVMNLPLEPSPAGDEVLYIRTYDEQSTYYTWERARFEVMDAATNAITTLERATSQGSSLSMFVGWAPDGDSFLIWSNIQNGLGIVARDGSGLTELGGPFVGAWLTDGSVVTFAGNPDVPDEIRLLRFDPTTTERTLLDISGDINLNLFDAEGALHDAGYDIDPASTDFHRATLLPDDLRVYVVWPLGAFYASGREFCYDWEIRGQPRDGTTPPELLAQIDAATAITDLSALPDGSLIFLRWTLTGCTFTGTMQVELMRLVPGEAPTVLVPDIDPGTFGNPNEVRNLLAIHGPKYAISPDGAYLLTLGGGVTTGTTTLNLLDLATGASAPLLSDVVTQMDESFESVVWLTE